MLKPCRLYSNKSPFRWLLQSSSRMATKRSLNQSSVSTLAKKKKTPVIGTHNGSFHCDEALACFLLRRTGKFSDAEVVRTRDLQVLESLDAVVDVGGVYDPSRDRYDHHQSGFSEVLDHGFTTKLSSAGLVYKHYGMEVVSKEVCLNQEHPNVHRLFLAVYKNFMEAVDAVDNGINQYDVDQPPKYAINTSLSSRVGRLNLDWIEDDHSAQKENKAFQRAMELTGNDFLDTLNFYLKSWLPARSIVMECLAARNSVDPSGEIVLLTKYCPWKLHIFELEEEMKIDQSIKYVIYQEDRNNTWRVQAVGVSPDKFESRKPLPSLWRGLEREKLSEVAGIPGCVFTHMSGFIGGNQTYEGALKMAKIALQS